MNRPYEDKDLPRAPFYRLTSVQHVLLRQVSEGLANKVIASRLGKSPNTVRNQIHTLFRITGARTRAEIARWYMRCVGDLARVSEPARAWNAEAEHRVVVTRHVTTFKDSEY